MGIHSLMALALGPSAGAAEKAAKEIHAKLSAHQEISKHHGDHVTILEKDMGNGVRCFYAVSGSRKTASNSDETSPSVSCLKVD